MANWHTGAAINLVGSVLINLGTNVMKLGHNRKAALKARTGKTVAIRKFSEWRLGVAIFAIGNLANFVSLGYAAQSLLAGLGAVQFLTNVAFASLVLNEKVTPTILVATGCIVLGCVLLVSFGSHESKQFSVQELMELYTRPVYVSYLIFMAATVFLMYAIYRFGKSTLSPGATSPSPHWNRTLPVSYALFSGLLGTQSVLFSKTLSTLLRTTLGGNNQLTSWFTWLVALVFICTATFWVSRLNKALKMFPALVIVPTMQISWTMFSIISGLLYFEEYRMFTYTKGFMFGVALVIVFIGVFFLTKTAIPEERTTADGKAALIDGFDGERKAWIETKDRVGSARSMSSEGHTPLKEV
ncbi:unnamed protein product [Ostreobium quekettii]|uniref:Probable magnesium transporter n=1 Tax=Ostreobium quekettii TaxID=121088 RepID=A0A8S1J1D8_9CHLO|nr:unnamed protein product [Ostreobium quekettii]|eukprot:evm.model.scf_482.2 EVM.evm.TU.scf_482.2   scf_482:13710-22811(-)